MQGLRIIGLLVGVMGFTLAWLMWPSDEDLERLSDKIDRHRPGIETALEQCSELIKELSQYKHTEKKKAELFNLRSQYEALDEETERFLEDELLERIERTKGLDALENRYWELMRNAEDLGSRLVAMRDFAMRRVEIMTRHGLLVRELRQGQATSTDPDFQRRANELLDRAKAILPLLERAMLTYGSSINDGNTMGNAAIRSLTEIHEGMEEILAAAGVGKDEAGAEDG